MTPTKFHQLGAFSTLEPTAIHEIWLGKDLGLEPHSLFDGPASRTHAVLTLSCPMKCGDVVQVSGGVKAHTCPMRWQATTFASRLHSRPQQPCHSDLRNSHWKQIQSRQSCSRRGQTAAAQYHGQSDACCNQHCSQHGSCQQETLAGGESPQDHPLQVWTFGAGLNRKFCRAWQQSA